MDIPQQKLNASKINESYHEAEIDIIVNIPLPLSDKDVFWVQKALLIVCKITLLQFIIYEIPQ